MTLKNVERRRSLISLIILFISGLAVVLPSLLGADMMGWGFALAFVGLAAALTALIAYFIFRGRAKVMDHILDKEQVLAHWHYETKFFDKIRAEDMADSGLARFGGAFIGCIFVIIGIVFLIIDVAENGLFALIMGGIGLFFLLVGFLAASAEKRRAARYLPEAIIARKGLFYKDQLTVWNAPSVAFLTGVGLSAEDDHLLCFGMREISGGGKFNPVRYRPTQIAVPIPQGEEQSAQRVIDYFGLPMDGNAS